MGVLPAAIAYINSYPPAKEQTKSHAQLFDEQSFRILGKLVNVS
jgi:hypothetical protein